MSQEFLNVNTIKNGIVVPFIYNKEFSTKHAGILDDQFKVVKNSLLFRSYGQVIGDPIILSVQESSIKHSDSCTIFGGYWENHFGHFLLETLQRLWILNNIKYADIPITWIKEKKKPVKSWQIDILNILGINNEIIFVEERCVKFNEIIIPDPGYRIRDFFHKKQKEFLAKYSEKKTLQFKKIWLSRSKLNERKTLNEDILENRLKQEGWKIVHLQNKTIEEQLNILASANILAGIEGSAFHLLILLKNPTKKVLIIRRSKNINYSTIASKIGLDQVDIYEEIISHGKKYDSQLYEIKSVDKLVEKIEKAIAILGWQK